MWSFELIRQPSGWWLIVGIICHSCVSVQPVQTGSSCVADLNGNANALAIGLWKDLSGAVEVVASSSPYNGYCSYRGLPFAKPPIGALRFEPPQISKPDWSGERYFNGSAEGNGESGPIRCVQTHWQESEQYNEVVGSEDCLYLNVHVPQVPDKSNNEVVAAGLPIVVWLHGGSFNLGHASSDVGEPDYLVMQGIIVVAINYRLCALGFLAIPEANITGNFGLLDQRIALLWVHRNIAAFGGDPGRVTLMGWSAGSASVGYQLSAADDADAGPLFHRAIMMSGAPNNPWAVQRPSANCTHTLLQKLNLTNVPAEELKSRLQNVFAAQLILPNILDNTFEYFGTIEYGFVPTVDGQLVRVAPHLMPPSPAVHRRPLLIGYMRIETVSQFASGFECRDVGWPDEINRKLPDILEQLDRFMERNVDAVGLMEDSVRRRKGLSFLENLRGIIDIKYGVWLFARRYHRIACKPIVYQMSYAGKLGSFRNMISSQSVGPVHGDELGYLSGDMNAIVDADEAKSTDNLIRNEVVKLWSNFIKTGKPTSDVNEECRSFRNNDDIELLDIDRNTSVIPLRRCWESDEYTFWDSIFQCVYGADCDKLENKYLNGNRTFWDSRHATDSRCMLYSSNENNNSFQ